MQKQLPFIVISFILMSFTDKNVTNESIIGLSEKDKTNCTFFKTSAGSNRLAVFEQLQSLVLIKNAKSNFAVNKQLYNNNTTMNRVIEIFGLPNHKIGNKTFIYTLDPKKGCKGIFQFDDTDTVVYVGIKDCN
jgi:hypothetical protein